MTATRKAMQRVRRQQAGQGSRSPAGATPQRCRGAAAADPPADAPATSPTCTQRVSFVMTGMWGRQLTCRDRHQKLTPELSRLQEELHEGRIWLLPFSGHT